MPIARILAENRSQVRFRITKFQYLLFAIASVSILALGYSSIVQSNSTIKEAKVLSDVETPAASIIFTQRETLVYATRLAQWSNGGTTRRSVQIARNILAQRLAVIDTSGRSMGERAQQQYWNALSASDAIVAAAPVGILPESLHNSFNQRISPIIDEILTQSRELAVSYQRSVDESLIENARRSADRDRLNLIFFYIFLVSGSLFLLLNARSNFKNYRAARNSLEREQEQLNRTLEDLHRAQSTVVELQSLNEAKTSFISTVSHELRTPLTSIIGYIDLIHELRQKDSAADISQYLDVLDRNAQILLHIVESILTISKIDSMKSAKVKEKVSINEVVDNCIFIMKPAIEQAHQSITLHAQEDIFVGGDAGQLSQVLINLIGNANKFSPEDSAIEVSLKAVTLKDGVEYAQIQVKDHGIGIPEEDIEKLTVRFFRAKNTESGQYPGTGLGLAIAQQIIDLHHGKLSITSILGEGTTITLLIPLYLTEEERMIQDRRGEVVARAIASLEEANADSAESVTHAIGGTIGFYGFESEGRLIIEYSRSITGVIPSASDFESDKTRLLALLKEAQANVSGEVDA